ncbi:MAG: EamA family transporter [Actinomycetota bacterium]
MGRYEGSRGMIWAALGAIYFFWGTTYLAIRVGVETMPPFLMASVRFLVAGGIMYVIAIRTGDRKGDRPTAAHWKSAAIIGTALLLGGNGLVSWAEQSVASGAASLIIATVPFWLVLIGRFALRDKVSGREWLGILAGFGGLVLLVNPANGGGIDPWGAGVLVMASIFWAAGSLYARSAPLPSRPLVGTAMEMIGGGVALGIVGIASGELGRLDISAISLESLLGLGWLIVFGSIVGFSAYVWLLRVTRTSLVGTYAYVNPIVAVGLGWLMLNEPITLRTVIAGAVIVVAVALIVSAKAPKEDVPAVKADAGVEPDAERERISA